MGVGGAGDGGGGAGDGGGGADAPLVTTGAAGAAGAAPATERGPPPAGRETVAQPAGHRPVAVGGLDAHDLHGDR